MNARLQPIRGTHDLLPKEFERFHAVITQARELARLYGFEEIATPIFESVDVFARSLGETSDIVHKEMFTFDTKGGESVTLRPEFTAGIVRAFLSNGMQQHLPLKLFSHGPVFRYERPQKGRQRQFHQINFEWLGDSTPDADIEMIMLAGHLLNAIGGDERKCTLLINTLGDHESRLRYRDAIVAYLTPVANNLSEDSRRRLVSNPLRILDSKDEGDRALLMNAPRINDYLSDSSRQRFDYIHDTLWHKEMRCFQAIAVEPSLVRGLDYYTDTVFEFVGHFGDIGAQNTILAGGRYNGLVEQMGGKPTPAIGFAAGIERLLLLLATTENLVPVANNIKIVLLPLGDLPGASVHMIAQNLRLAILALTQQSTKKYLLKIEIAWQSSLKKRMEKAASSGATHVLLLGEEEAARGVASLRDMQTRQQYEVPLDDLKNSEKLSQLFQIEP